MRTCILGLLLTIGLAAFAQDSTNELPRIVREAGLTLALPSLEESRFDTTGGGAGYDSHQMGWRHRGGEFELRVRVVPAGEPGSQAPAVHAGATATHCAKNLVGDANELTDFVGRWRGGTEDLRRLGAEWVYFFDYAPKPAISPRLRCYQTSYFRQRLGLVHLWLLYDDPKYLHSDWAYILPFDGQPQAY